jgi:hypothetical protein
MPSPAKQFHAIVRHFIRKGPSAATRSSTAAVMDVQRANEYSLNNRPSNELRNVSYEKKDIQA